MATDTDRDAATLSTLPGDDLRAILWGYADRFDLQMLAQSTRGVARGLVARLVAEGARHSHEWTPQKERLLAAFDEAGITAAFLEPEFGGYLEGPKNLALALIAFELAWVDAGAATCSLAGNLGLAPINERGTEAQRASYMRRGAPPRPGEDRRIWRGAFALTEPLPYVGVETGLLSGKVVVAEWPQGGEPLLKVDKRGRFITNMGFADYVSVAVESADPRIKGSCMIVIERTDPGLFDRGAPTRKMVHQLSSTNDPVFSVVVPASRIIGGYEIRDGVLVPRYGHGEVIEAVFRRTRVTIGAMAAAKLLSAVEPVIRYQRQRFRGGAGVSEGSVRFDLGLQQKEDPLHRLVDLWAVGEAAASLGFEAARVFDEFDPLEKKKNAVLAGRGIAGGRAERTALAGARADAFEWIRLSYVPEERRDPSRLAALAADDLARYAATESLADVLCPACKLWNTGYGATVMREAVSLMGGYGITEDCPGFLMNKWMDIQLEATYEGPEAVQRRQLGITMTNELFLERFKLWIGDLRGLAASRPRTGARPLAAAMDLWLWTLGYLASTQDAHGAKLLHGNRQGVSFPLADALCWLLASRSQIADVVRLEREGGANPALADGLAGAVGFLSDLSTVMAMRAAGEVGRVCAELVLGYAADGTPDAEFARLRSAVDTALAGARFAKDRAAQAISRVMIPEALDYPA